MSNALSAILQGLERGAGMGLNMYQAMNAEARANRQEQFQRNRAARSDFESDRAHRTQMERYQVADEQWEKTYQNTLEELGLKRQQLDDTREHYRGMRGIYQRQQDLSERKFDNELETQARARAQERLRRMTQAYGLTEDGRELTRDEFYKRFQNSPDAGTYLALHGFVEGLYGSDRLTRYRGATAVPVGDGRFSVGVTSADGSFEGVKPATVRGSSDPDDPVMATDPYEAYLSYLPPDRAEALRNQSRDDALIDHDRGADEASVERDFQRGVARMEDGVKEAEQELERARASLAEIEANRPTMREPTRLSIADNPVNELNRQRDAEQELARWNAKRDAASQRVASLEAFIESAPERRNQYQTARDATLEGIGSQYDRARLEGNYTGRSQQRRTQTAAARTKAVEDGLKAIDGAVRAANTHGEKVFGKEFKGRLNPNDVKEEFGRLDPDLRVALVNAPGGIEAAVQVMAEHGLTSFDYILDALSADVKPATYMEAVKDPAVAEVTGGNPDATHRLAVAYARHMAQHPNAPKESVLLALSQGEEPPTGQRRSLSLW